MPSPWFGSYKVAAHTRFNDGTSSDLSMSLAQRPGWVLSAEAFSLSSVAVAHLFLYDTSGSITTASTPFWQGVIPFGVFVEGSTRAPVGAGFIADLQGITLNNGLAYAVSSNAAASSISTAPAQTVKVSLQYVTSSCL